MITDKLAKALATITGTSDGLSKYMINVSMSQSIRDFQDDIRKRREYYKGEHKDLFVKYLNENYKDLSIKEDLENCFRPYNLVQIVVDGVSVVYSERPERKLINNQGEPVQENEEKLYEWLCESLNLDCFMQTVNKYVSLCDTVLVRPFWYKGKIELEIITPDNFFVIEDPLCNTKPLAIYHWSLSTDKNGNAITTFYIWTQDTVAVGSEHGDNSNIGYLPSYDNYTQNIYGVLPFARFVHSMPMDEYLSMTGSELVDMQESINIENAQLAHLVKMQSFSIPVLIGYDVRDSERIKVSPGKPIVIPLTTKDDNPPSVQFITPSPKIQEFIDYIKTRLNMYLYKVGLQTSQFGEAGSQEASGVALAIKNERLVEKRRSEIPFYQMGEAELFEIIKAVWNVHCEESEEFNGVRFSDNTRLLIDIPEPKTIVSSAERREDWDWLIAMGLRTPVDYLKEVDGLSPEDAEKRYEENRQIRSQTTFEVPEGIENEPRES